MDNNNNLPQNNVNAVNWPWDFEATSFSTLIKYGATRNMVYCPANPGQNIDGNWFYGGGTIHTIGYAMTFPGPGLLFTNINASLIPKSFPFGPIIIPPPAASKRVLVADAVISAHGQTNASSVSTYDFSVNLTGGAIGPNDAPFHHRTNHLLGPLPSGGNVGMLDGHVEWRKFKDMISRMDPGDPATTLTWWW